MGNTLSKNKVAYLFSGQASQYFGMGGFLYKKHPVFKETIDQCSLIASDYLGLSLIDLIYMDSENSDALIKTIYAQPILFSVQIALARMWESSGLSPSYVLGHSVGEFAAACVAGVFSMEVALKMVIERGRLMQSIHEKGGMLAVFANSVDVYQLINRSGINVSIAAINSHDNVIISGAICSLLEFESLLCAEGINHKVLNVSHAFHSSLMAPIVSDFVDFAKGFKFYDPAINYISSITGCLAHQGEISCANYWGHQITSPVLFEKGVAELDKYDVDILLEIGPDDTLSKFAKSTLYGVTSHFYPSLSRLDKGFDQTLSTAISLSNLGFPLSMPVALIPHNSISLTNTVKKDVNQLTAAILKLQNAIYLCSGSRLSLTPESILDTFGLSSLVYLKLRVHLIKNMGYTANTIAIKTLQFVPIGSWLLPDLENYSELSSAGMMSFLVIPALAIFGELGIADKWANGSLVDLIEHCENNALVAEKLVPLAEYLTWHGFLTKSNRNYSPTTLGLALIPQWPSAMLYYSYYPLLTELYPLSKGEKLYGVMEDVYRNMYFDSKASGQIGIRTNIFKQSVDYLLDKKINKLLDLGCGDGTFLLYVAQQIPSLTVIGLDQSRVALDLAEQKFNAIGYSSRVSLIEANLMTPKSIISSADLVNLDIATIFFILHELAYEGTDIVVKFLQHFGEAFPDTKLAVTEQYRLSTPDINSYLELGYSEFLTLHDISNQRLLYRTEWLDIFEQANYKVHKILEPETSGGLVASWGTFIIGV